MHTLLETLIVLPDGRQVRLGDVVTVTPRNVLANILRENQQYQRTVAYDFHGPARLGDAVLEAVLARTEVPQNIRRAHHLVATAEEASAIAAKIVQNDLEPKIEGYGKSPSGHIRGTREIIPPGDLGTINHTAFIMPADFKI